MRYRKKPVIVSAMKWTGDNEDEIRAFLGPSKRHIFQDGELFIGTLEGRVIASPGCYIVKGICGEFYPCRADIFEETYEKVEE